jgi:hypothetical protein
MPTVFPPGPSLVLRASVRLFLANQDSLGKGTVRSRRPPGRSLVLAAFVAFACPLDMLMRLRRTAPHPLNYTRSLWGRLKMTAASLSELGEPREERRSKSVFTRPLAQARGVGLGFLSKRSELRKPCPVT